MVTTSPRSSTTAIPAAPTEELLQGSASAQPATGGCVQSPRLNLFRLPAGLQGKSASGREAHIPLERA